MMSKKLGNNNQAGGSLRFHPFVVVTQMEKIITQTLLNPTFSALKAHVGCVTGEAIALHIISFYFTPQMCLKFRQSCSSVILNLQQYNTSRIKELIRQRVFVHTAGYCLCDKATIQTPVRNLLPLIKLKQQWSCLWKTTHAHALLSSALFLAKKKKKKSHSLSKRFSRTRIDISSISSAKVQNLRCVT